MIRKLHERKYRSESGQFYIEGIRIVLEALVEPGRIQSLVISPELLQSQKAEEAIQIATKNRVPVIEVSQSVFESFSLKDSPQGLAAIVTQKWHGLEEIQPTSMGLWVGLDSVADPGNLGTIMRTMDAVGAHGVILIDNCTDPHDPSAVRASMGAVFSLKFVKTTSDNLIPWKKANKVPMIGTSDSASSDYQAVNYPVNMVLSMGSERQGLQKPLMDACDQIVSIPMAGRSDSLNLAVAAGVMLYEIYNQKRKKGLK